MPTGEKQPPISAKKIALRDSLTEINSLSSIPLNNSPPNDGGSIPDTPKQSGTKREQPSSPFTPHPHQQSSPGGHLVYVRRKLDTEPSKICSENAECTDPCLSNNWKDQTSQTKSKEQDAKHSGFSAMLSSPSFLISPLRSEPLQPIWKPGNSLDELCWKERFIRLQMFLKNCDQSNQEKYIQSLRSLSATGRSMHAVELEKRAIQLLLDEGYESSSESDPVPIRFRVYTRACTHQLRELRECV